MADKKIDGAPKRAAKSLGAPTWSENKNTEKLTLQGTWKTTAGQFKKTSGTRTEWFSAKWSFTYKISSSEIRNKKTKYSALAKKERRTLNVTPKKSIAYPKKKPIAKGPKKMSGQATVAVYKIPDSYRKLSQTVNRKAFYPFKRSHDKKKGTSTYRFLDKVTFQLAASNSYKNKKSKKAYSSSKYLKKSITFDKPGVPTIGGVSIDKGTHTWSCTITAAESKGKKERYDTMCRVLRKQNFGDAKYKDWGEYKAWVAFEGDSKTLSDTFGDIGALTYSQYIGLKVEAYSRGLAGRNDQKPKIRYFSYPSQPTISKVDVVPENTDNNIPTGRIVVHCKSNSTTEHPTDVMTLEVLKNSVYTDPSEAAASGNWTPVGIAGNQATTAFADTFANAYPVSGRKVWYRIKSEHDQFVRYSNPYRVKALEHDVGKSEIVTATVVDDGVNPTGIKLEMGLTNRATGTEVEWSKFKNAVDSNKPPDSYQQKRVRSKAATEALNEKYNTKYDFSTVFYITELEEGGKYYLSARRYNEGDQGTEYGDRTYWKTAKDIQPVLFARKPTEIQVSVPSYVEATAKSFEISWTFESAVKQTSYAVYGVTAERDEHGQVVYNDSGKAKPVLTPLTAKDTEEMFAVIEASQAKRCVENGRLILRVDVSCGGPNAMSSNSEAIPVVKKPSVTLDISSAMPDGLLRAQEESFSYSVDQLDSKVYLRIVSDGVVYPYPDGDYDQAAGEILYTGVLTPSAVRVPIELSMPKCDFLDGGRYTMTATPVGRTGLQGEPVQVSFRVDWAHQAHAAGPLTRVVGDSNSVTATIHTEKPDNWVDGDLCDIYRVTPDGAYLIAQGRPFGQDVVDQFAPYSKRANLRYRIVTVTEDGDLDWVDVPYNLRVHGIRFDWVGSRAGDTPEYHSVTLPYNVKFSDSWTKQFEKVRDLEGAAVGWWAPGVDRKATLSTDMIRLGDIENKELVRELATHTGPVFVRTPNGCAFTANVNVTSFADDYDSLVSPVSFDAEEIDLTEEFEIQNEDLT